MTVAIPDSTDVLLEDATLEIDEDDGNHMLCCDLGDDFVGFTVTFCGKQVLESDVSTIPDGEQVECVRCRILGSHESFCPVKGVCGG